MDLNYVLCTVCDKKINYSKTGCQALTQHSKGKSQQKNATIVGSQQKIAIKNNVVQININKERANVIKAEIIWAIKSVMSNYSANSCENISNVFSLMFDCETASKFHMSRTKMSYLITEGLSHFFIEDLKKDIRDSFYSLLFDETTNNESEKELQIMIRYWSKLKNEIVTRHLETFFICDGKANTVKDHLFKAIDNFGLPYKKLTMVGSDGPNVNKKVFRMICDHLIEMDYRALIDIGTCNLHIVHNSFFSGLEMYGLKVSDFIIDVFNFFHKFPNRKADYEVIQEKKKVKKNCFKKHVSSRWLSINLAAKRIIEQWSALVEYFLKYVPNYHKSLEKTERYVRIRKKIEDPLFKPQIFLIIESSELFEHFSKVFQKSTPIIHLVYDELMKLLIILSNKISKKPIKELENDFEESFSDKNLLNFDEIKLSDDILNCLKSVKEINVLYFKQNYRLHFKKASSYLISHFDKRTLKLFRHFQCLSNFESEADDIIQISKFFSMDINTDILLAEWISLKSEKLMKCERIDCFWNQIFLLNDQVSQKKYPNLEKIVRMSLVLSCGNADVEREFSKSKGILSEDKTLMSLKMLNSRLIIKYALKIHGNKIENIEITDKMIMAASYAHKKYLKYLDEQKKIEDDLEESRRLREQEDEKLEQHEKEMNVQKSSIKQLQEKIGNLKSKKELEKETIAKLLAEADNRLKKAMDDNDMSEIKLAQSMLKSANVMKRREEQIEQELFSAQKEVEKRKDFMLQSQSKRFKKA